MMKINYKSDFDFYLRLTDPAGIDIGFPEFDWTARIWTFSRANSFIASCIAGKCVNCRNDNDRILIIADNHHLCPGQLQVEFSIEIPEEIHPDGSHRFVASDILNIELVRGNPASGAAVAEVTLKLPALPAGYPDGDQSAVITQPLPFKFADFEYKDTVGGDICFDRYRNEDFFFIKGADGECEAIDPADGPYNIYAADGRIIANTDRLFICGRTVYRYTGRELVNVAIEQNPNQRLVSRTPSVNAHPGLVYLDRGFIRLPIHSGENRVSLEGLYCKFDVDHPVPLAEAVAWMDVYDAAGEEVKVEIIDNCVVFNIGEIEPGASGHVMARLGFNTQGQYDGRVSFIGVRYDTGGRKIFYQTSAGPAPEPVQPPNIGDAFEWNPMEMRGEHSCYIDPPGSSYQTELWLKRRHGTGSKTRRVGTSLRKKWRHLRNDRQWRWRRNNRGMLINRNSFLMRMRRVGDNRRSEWAYFHVNLRRFAISGHPSDRFIRPARQVRT